MATQSPIITGYTYDKVMLKHECVWSEHHENSGRLSSILDRCRELKLFDRCLFVKVIFLYRKIFYPRFLFSQQKQTMMIFYYIILKIYLKNYPMHLLIILNN